MPVLVFTKELTAWAQIFYKAEFNVLSKRAALPAARQKSVFTCCWSFSKMPLSMEVNSLQLVLVSAFLWHPLLLSLKEVLDESIKNCTEKKNINTEWRYCKWASKPYRKCSIITTLCKQHWLGKESYSDCIERIVCSLTRYRYKNTNSEENTSWQTVPN